MVIFTSAASVEGREKSERKIASWLERILALQKNIKRLAAPVGNKGESLLEGGKTSQTVVV